MQYQPVKSKTTHLYSSRAGWLATFYRAKTAAATPANRAREPAATRPAPLVGMVLGLEVPEALVPADVWVARVVLAPVVTVELLTEVVLTTVVLGAADDDEDDADEVVDMVVLTLRLLVAELEAEDEPVAELLPEELATPPVIWKGWENWKMDWSDS